MSSSKARNIFYRRDVSCVRTQSSKQAKKKQKHGHQEVAKTGANTKQGWKGQQREVARSKKRNFSPANATQALPQVGANNNKSKQQHVEGGCSKNLPGRIKKEASSKHEWKRESSHRAKPQASSRNK